MKNVVMCYSPLVKLIMLISGLPLLLTFRYAYLLFGKVEKFPQNFLLLFISSYFLWDIEMYQIYYIHLVV